MIENKNANNFELLLPVGQKEMALAAIHNGADAIYIGFPGFNARGRSYDFEISELKEIIEICHLYGVKVNLAFNIVIFENEISKVIDSLYAILPLKPDALIVQDLGLVQIIRKMAPNQPIHASTQMTITNDLAIQLLDDLNIKRFVLGRENSLNEIKLIKEKTNKELEVFVHGALCVSYSGQCFTSESLGGRSANRGQCAQSCRFSYDLIVDGTKMNSLDKSYLVSPQDLCGINEIPELMKIGVTSYKIEGRLKTPDYVASAAKYYRQAMDKYLGSEDLNSSELMKAKKDMAVTYSRGFFSGWLNGVNHQKLVRGDFKSHRGSPVGVIKNIIKNELVIELDDDFELKNGDGLLWLKKSINSNEVSDKNEIGSFIFSAEKVKHKTFKVGVSNDVELSFNMIGSEVYLNHDKDLKKDLTKSYTDKNLFKKIPVTIEIILKSDQPIAVQVSDSKHLVVKKSQSNLTKAEKKPLTDNDIKSEFSSLGGTVFEIDKMTITRMDHSDLFLSAKELKVLRQTIFEELGTLRKNNYVRATEVSIESPENIKTWFFENKFINNNTVLENNKPGLKLNFNLLLRNKNQVNDLILAFDEKKLIQSSFNSITLDFEFGRDYSDSIKLLKNYNLKVGVATTRILKPQEYNNLKIIKNLNPDFILVRNLGALFYYKNDNVYDGELIGDFSLNVTNHLTAQYLFSKGLKTVCLSYDLNKEQVSEILDNTNSNNIEITMHQFMPSFHMEHCVFAAFLSQGSSYKDCGKPCEKHTVQLKDQFGHKHWIKPDHECRNTMFNSRAQTAIKFISDWSQKGLGFVRYEALHEVGDELINNLLNYILFLESKQDLEVTVKNLSTRDSYGLSEGSFAREHKYQSRKKDFSSVNSTNSDY